LNQLFASALPPGSALLFGGGSLRHPCLTWSRASSPAETVTIAVAVKIPGDNRDGCVFSGKDAQRHTAGAVPGCAMLVAPFELVLEATFARP
jgi:hypothetical protein